MRARVLIPLLLAAAVPTAHASPVLIATGSLDSTAAGPNVDLSGLAGTLENGLPANILGGMGSGLAYAGGNTFLGLPDRGPNATPYNGAVDDTVSYISRFHTMSLVLTPSAPGSALPYTLTPVMQSTTLLSSPTPLIYGTGDGLGNKKDGTPLGSGAPAQNTPDKFFFTGRSDNFDPKQSSGNPSNARLDPESIRVSNDRKSVFVSDEYGPYVYQFDRATGQRIKTFTLPNDPAVAGNLDVTKLSPVGSTEISGNTTGRTANKGMEGLAITPDGKTLVGFMQAALIQDAADKSSKKLLRLVTIDVATGATHDFGYLLTTGSGVSEVVAINDHEFLVDERDGTGLGNAPGEAALVKQVFKIDITGATDITNMTGKDAVKNAILVKKSAAPVLDIVTALNDAGIPSTNIPSKIEGLAFGQDVEVNGALEHTLWVANDNDFTPDGSGSNRWFVFAVSDEDLGGSVLQQQAFIPEPGTLALLLPGLAALWRRRARHRSAG